MGAPQIKNPEVVRAIDALTVYRNILIKMAQTEKNNANQLSLQFMLELNGRLINLLNEMKDNDMAFARLPSSLHVKPENLKEFFADFNKGIESGNLVTFSKSQKTKMEKFTNALLELPEDVAEAFTMSMLVVCAELGISALASVSVCLLLLTPELILPVLAIYGVLLLPIGFAGSIAVAFVYGLTQLGFKATASHDECGNAYLASNEISALSDLVELTQGQFSASLPNTGEGNDAFDEIKVTYRASNTRQLFFTPKHSDTSLADKAAANYETVRGLMHI